MSTAGSLASVRRCLSKSAHPPKAVAIPDALTLRIRANSGSRGAGRRSCVWDMRTRNLGRRPPICVPVSISRGRNRIDDYHSP
jgi:hypothetical protein